MAAAKEDKWVECGFCCRRNEALEEPKTLPCGHIHCFGCLSASFVSINIVKCPLPICGKVFDVTLASLPSNDLRGGDVLCCDACVKKGKGNQKPDIYCYQCDKKDCTNHLESHDDIHENHTTIGIEMCKTQEARLQKRMCEEHKDQPYNVGCKTCFKVACVACLPELESCTDDLCRDIELDILSVEGVHIDSQLVQTIPISPPKSLTLLNTVKLCSFVWSVFSYKGNTYVGVGGIGHGSIEKIDERFNHSCFVSFGKSVYGLAVYEDRVYSILCGSPRVLHVHDLSGKLLLKWDLSDVVVGYYIGLVVCADQLVVPDIKNKQLVVYALTGSVVKRISCAQISASDVSLCAVGDNSVVVSDDDTSKVFKVNISSGEIKWTCAEIAKPQGVTCYREKYVLVASAGRNTLNILDLHTGKVMSQITNQHICGSGNWLFDMHISGNTLVIANFETHSADFFQLNL